MSWQGYEDRSKAQHEARMAELAEEDLSDEALEGETRAAALDFLEGMGEAQTAAGDTYSEETGEVLKDAPGWDKTTRTILNRDGLEWAGRRLREVEEALAENHRAAAAELKELEERLRKAQERHAKADAPLLASRAFFDAAIRVYADSHRAELLKGRRGKTARLPSGLVLAWKSGGGEYRWRKDMKPAEREAALVEWAVDQESRGAGELCVNIVKPDLAAIKAHLAAPGGRHKDAPPGLEYVPEHEELSVKVEDDK